MPCDNHKVYLTMLKAVSATFLLIFFLRLKESTCETRKNDFYFTSKALFLRWSNFNFSDIQISVRNQMPKQETRNTYYWITWEVNTVFFIEKLYEEYGLETSLIFKESSVKTILRRSACWFGKILKALLLHIQYK